MKTIKLQLFALTVMLGLNVLAQQNHRGEKLKVIYFAEVGEKMLSFDNLHSEMTSKGYSLPENAFTLGAGLYLNTKRMIFGLDFYNSKSSSENDKNQTKYAAFTNSFFTGYKLVNKNNIMLSPIVGVVMTSNTFSMYDLRSSLDLNSFSILNTDFSARVGVMFEFIDKFGLSYGLSTGYDFSLGSSDWKIEGSDIETGINDQQGGFYISLILGGHIFLSN